MKMNRRNVLIGLGAIATGGGAAFGSGAFSSVSANREVTLGINSDQNALVNLSANGSAVFANDSSGSGNVNELGIDAQQLNNDAKTVSKSEFDITHDAPGDRLVAIDDSAISSSFGVTFYAYEEVNDGTYSSNPADLSQGYITLSNSGDLTVGIEANVSDPNTTLENATIDINVVDDSSDFGSASGYDPSVNGNYGSE